MFWLDQIPYFEVGDSVAYNNEKEGIIECLKKDVGVVDLDSGVSSLPEWISTKAILTTWLADALAYELWLGCEGSSAYSIYYSDLPWPLGKILSWKKAIWVKLKHGITNDNAEVKKEEVSFSFLFFAWFSNFNIFCVCVVIVVVLMFCVYDFLFDLVFMFSY